MSEKESVSYFTIGVIIVFILGIIILLVLAWFKIIPWWPLYTVAVMSVFVAFFIKGEHDIMSARERVVNELLKQQYERTLEYNRI